MQRGYVPWYFSDSVRAGFARATPSAGSGWDVDGVGEHGDRAGSSGNAGIQEQTSGVRKATTQSLARGAQVVLARLHRVTCPSSARSLLSRREWEHFC